MSTGRKLVRFVAICLLPAIVALWSIVGWGAPFPWQPATEDLRVYREAARYLLEGRDFYALQDSFPYIYPPIAAILAIPLALMPWRAAQIVWTLLNVVVLVAVLRHVGIRPAWLLSFLAAAAIIFIGPVDSTLELGQLGVLLLGLVVLDAVDGPRPLRGGGRRMLPAGVLTGLATGLKLTPAVFIVYYFCIKRYRQGFVALGTFAAVVVVGLVVAPQESWGYWVRLAGGDAGANPDAHGWIGNISVLSAVYRFTDVTTAGTVIGLGLSALLVVAGIACAWACHRAGHDLLGVSILGLVSSVANPIAWMHHLTWVVPLLVAGLRDRLPEPLRWSVLIGALWCIIHPQLYLPGAPWAQTEIHEYAVAEKLLAAGPAIVVMLMVVLALATARPADASGTVRRSGVREPARRGPKQALMDGEIKA